MAFCRKTGLPMVRMVWTGEFRFTLEELIALANQQGFTRGRSGRRKSSFAPEEGRSQILENGAIGKSPQERYALKHGMTTHGRLINRSGFRKKVGYNDLQIFVVNREYSLHCHGLVHGCNKQETDRLQRIVAKTIATVRWSQSAVNWRLSLPLAGPKSAVSADIDYHWGGELDAKQGELLQLCGEAS